MTGIGDGGLAVSHAGGHGRIVLPPAYASEHVALAYAVTVHKAKASPSTTPSAWSTTTPPPRPSTSV